MPGVFSQGHTLEELEQNILDAYNLMIEGGEEALLRTIKDKVKQIRIEI